MARQEIYLKEMGDHTAIILHLKSMYNFIPDEIFDKIYAYSYPINAIFGPLIPSTLTAQGMLSNVRFEEKDLIFAVEPVGRVKKITCNYGEVFSADYKNTDSVKKQTNRGRKPKIKRRNTRKIQGSGKYFNSQITFWVESECIAGKYYGVKLFREGTTEIPGGLQPSMDDIYSATRVVCDLVGDCFVEDVHIVELYSIMRNYKFAIIHQQIRVNITCIHAILVDAQNKNLPTANGITEIKYNIERYPGLIIKFSTPIPKNPHKQTTIKMFQSGKVNIDGAISEQGAEYHYQWIINFYSVHEKDILYVPNTIVQYSDSDASDNETNSQTTERVSLSNSQTENDSLQLLSDSTIYDNL